MGHYCRLCHRNRPNECFSGRGHRSHVCEECQRRPPAHRERIELIDELLGFMAQSNISEKNIRRLETLGQAGDPRVCALAETILEVARVHPRKRRRYVFLARNHHPLLLRLKRVMGDAWWDDLVASGTLGETWEEPGPAVEASGDGESKPLVAENGFKRVTIHTDGACQINPGPGGWAAVLRYGGHVKELKGADPNTTNNRMELQAALSALRALKEPCAVEIHTDSKYLRDGITRWLARWKANGWKTLGRTPVKNQDLWQQLDELCARHKIEWRWLKAHAGHRDNERCDQLARGEIAKLYGAARRTEIRRPEQLRIGD